MISNPDYKGKWYAPQIDNPAYKGEWKAKQIDNPDFYEDLEPYKVTADTPRRPPPAAAVAEDDDQVCVCAGTRVSLLMCRHAIICVRCPALRDR